MRNKAKRLSALVATALVALVVIGPIAASAQVTTTTGGATTTTLPVQHSKHGETPKGTTNACQSVLDPPLQPPGATTIGVKLAADAFGNPHEGKPITLSNTKVTISIPAALLQAGVDAGIVFDGMTIPSVITFAIAGAGTTQKVHNYTLNATVTVHVVGGAAAPLTSTFSLPDTTWTPESITKQVDFSEKSMKIVSTLDLSSTLAIIVTATFTCSGGPVFLSLGGLTTEIQTTTTTTTTTTTAPPVVPQAPPAEPSTLPRTGSSAGLLLAIAVGLLTAGLFALKATSRRSDVARSRNS